MSPLFILTTLYIIDNNIICMKEDMSSTTQDETVSKMNGGWSQQDLDEIRSMQCWEVKSLKLSNNDRPTVVKEISHIRFTALTELWLPENGICSIEGLERMHVPQIKTILLRTCGEIEIGTTSHQQLLSGKGFGHHYISSTSTTTTSTIYWYQPKPTCQRWGC